MKFPQNIISRRVFLKMGVGTAFLSNGLLRAISAENSSDVAVSKADAPADAVKKAIDALGGMQQFVKAGQTVIIKPNMSFPNPAQWATTTNPQVIKSVAQLCVDAGAKRVLIVDHPMRQPEKCLERNGIQTACANMKKVAIRMEVAERGYNEISVNGKALEKTKVLRKVNYRSERQGQKQVVLINVPVAKSHSATGVSFGMKNLMGLVWDRTYFHSGIDIHQAIADLNTIIRPQLTIVDATTVLLTRGPEGPGQTKQLNTVIAGRDPVAVDAYATTLERWNGRKLNPQDVRYIIAANELELGQMDLNKINIKSV